MMIKLLSNVILLYVWGVMRIKKNNVICLVLLLIMFIGLLSVASASYQGTGFTHNIPNNYYDSYSAQDILNKYNDTYLTAEETSTCTKVVDGDTIYLSNGKKVRLVGVNTPERGVKGYQASKDFVKKLCLNKEISINRDDRKYTDKYGRTLAVVIVGSKNLNEMLLKEGLAEVMYIPPSEFNPYNWAGDNVQNSYSSTSSSVGSDAQDMSGDAYLNQGSSNSNSNNVVKDSSSGSYIGNINSMKFHKSTCKEVNRMSEKNKVFFNSRDDAINGGYVGCKVCNP